MPETFSKIANMLLVVNFRVWGYQVEYELLGINLKSNMKGLPLSASGKLQSTRPCAGNVNHLVLEMPSLPKELHTLDQLSSDSI